MALLGLLLLGFALSVDFTATAQGFKGDEATYYCLTYSLARDLDFEYRREDLVRVWRELPGPQGLFLKKGRTVSFTIDATFPFVHLVQGDDPDRERLYYGKAYIYPLVAAPFVRVFDTNGFLVLHALLLTLDVLLAYVILSARGLRPAAAVAFALVFFGASVAPVYFVWLMPELFNLSLVMYAVFLWAYKELPGSETGQGRLGRFLRSGRSDLAAAVLLGVATFSKPPHILLIALPAGLAALRGRWRHAAAVAGTFGVVLAGLFAVNLAVTGDINYQGGERKTFYGAPPAGSTYVGPAGFPFATPAETFETTGYGMSTDEVPVDVLVSGDTFRVFRVNVWYFFVGRYSGLVPYFFPGMLSLVLFLAARRHRAGWQWLVLGVLAATAGGLLLYMPATYSGGGGPIGNRYYLSFYPLFLILLPPTTGVGAAAVAMAVGAAFTAKLLFNPFHASRNPGDHAKAGPLRLLPIELTTLNDLPVAAHADRSRLPVGGDPSLRAYFPDDNAFALEGRRFWVKGAARADVILRAPFRPAPEGRVVPLMVVALDVEVANGGAANEVTIQTGRDSQTLSLQPFEQRRVRVEMPSGVPYKPWRYPTNYTYQISIGTTAGFVPYLESPGSTDARFLGAMIGLEPVYAEAGAR